MWSDPKFLAFTGYFLLMVGIGIYTMKFSSKGIKAFFIGDRQLSKYVVALSAVVSGRSAWTFLALSGLAYANGPSTIWWVVGFIVMEMLLFFFYARKMRVFSEKRDCITVPDFLAARFGDRAGSLRIACVAVILVFVIPYLGAQFMAGGDTLAGAFTSDEFNVSKNVGVMTTAGIVLAYTFLGGFLAVSLTDTIQAFFMIIALTVLPSIVIAQLGGFEALYTILDVIGESHVNPFFIAGGAGIAISGLALGLGSVGNPHITSRYMAIKDVDGLRTAGLVGTVWNVVLCWGSIFVGLAGRAAAEFEPSLVVEKNDMIFTALVNEYLPGPLAGVVLAAVFAAIMSTADSQLLVAAAAIVRDIYQKVVKKSTEVSQKTLMVMSRAAVAVLVVFALLIGMTDKIDLHGLVILAWSGPGAALGPIALLAVYWKRSTMAGAISGMLTGASLVLFWTFSDKLGVGVEKAGEFVSLKVGIVDGIVPGFFGCLIVAVVVSLLTQPPEETDQLVADFSG